MGRKIYPTLISTSKYAAIWNRKPFCAEGFFLRISSLCHYHFCTKHPRSGKVTDQNGNGLEGVTIQVKGTNTATKTAKNGVYQIAVPSEKSVLLVSHVGFDEQELTVGNQREIGITLKASANTMEDVVVIGYGTRKRSDVTGSVSTLKNENFQERAISRVDQALVGQLAGVTVKQTTGVPGKAFSIQVRGSGSISGGNEPLYVN